MPSNYIPPEVSMWVVEAAGEALSRIVRSPDGAKAAVDGNVLNCVAELLDSPHSLVLRWTCRMLGDLASHRSTATAVLGVCAQIVSLLGALRFWFIQFGPHFGSYLERFDVRDRGRGEDYPTFRSSIVFALAKISEHHDGVANLAATDFLAHVSALMDSDDHIEQQDPLTRTITVLSLMVLRASSGELKTEDKFGSILNFNATPFAVSYPESPHLKIKLVRAPARHNEYEPEDG
ncbi:hypothetical protein DFH09DRAFT_1314859 [Mycena vulgaris]|nr:hypothetical protein DFH09DRAFT_1314859 [Mycena vulgaris]